VQRELGAFSLSEAERGQMNEVIDLCKLADEKLKKEERLFQRGELLSNLSAFYELIGDHDNGLACSQEAVNILPDNKAALTNLWSAQIKSAKYDDAFDTATKLKKNGGGAVAKLQQCEALLLSHKCQELIKELENEPDLLPELKKNPRYFEIKAEAFFKENDIPAAFGIINEAIGQFPENSGLYCTRASLYQQSGQPDLAQSDFDKAEKVGNKPDLRSQFDASMYYYGVNNWDAAVTRLVRLKADSIYSPFFKYYLACLFNLKQFRKCFDLAEKRLAVNADYLSRLVKRSDYSKHTKILSQFPIIRENWFA
jgi:tetratricopeptide (TPR) repeat protein